MAKLIYPSEKLGLISFCCTKETWISKCL